jgi:hypothetical protein
MALFIRQEESRTKLQEQIAAGLQERARAKATQVERPDGVTDSHYMKGTKQTSRLAWIWVLVVVVVIAACVWIIIATTVHH